MTMIGGGEIRGTPVDERGKEMKKEGFCTACQQALPRIQKGDFVQFTGGVIGIVCMVGVKFVTVTLLSGPDRGYSGLWTQSECRVVHGYMHIDRRAR